VTRLSVDGVRQHEGMHADLAETEWDSVGAGRIDGPDGTTYVRASTRAKRGACDVLIASGSPLVQHYWAGGQLDWYDGDDALAAWASARRQVTQEPRPRGDLEWTAGIWRSDDGRELVLLTGHC
jgi:hypothetical protein